MNKKRMSPAAEYLARKKAELAAKTIGSPFGGQRPDLTVYELTKGQLNEHKRSLKTIKSVQRKIEAKRSMIREYDPYIDGTLKAATGAPDDIFTVLLIWNIDAGNFDRAVQMASYAIPAKMDLPDNYERGLPDAVAEELADAAIKGQGATYAQLSAIEQMVNDTDMHDQIMAKLYKAMGWSLIGKTSDQDADWKNLPADAEAIATALRHLKNALALHEHVGVKKDIERLERIAAGLPDDEQPGGIEGDEQSKAAGEPAPESQPAAATKTQDEKPTAKVVKASSITASNRARRR